MTAMNQNVHLISLGCARNRVDSEVMLGTLLGEGWTHTENPEEAGTIIVNTCGFIGPAKQESIDTILEAAEYKKSNPDLKLVVTGCLTQRYKTQLAKGLPEVDFFVGTDQFNEIKNLLGQEVEKGEVFAKRTHYLYNENLPRINTLSKTAAYVKVAEGCQHNCAFCIIPAIRGKLRSRPVKSVVEECKKLADEGVLEINLIAQDLAAYGRDTGTADLHELLTELVKIEGIERIRCLYMYPENISDEFLEFIAKEPKIVKYLDVPVQHASDRILEAMNRDVRKNQLRDTLKKVREKVPGMAIRTSVMVGFPGETEEDFQELKNFVAEQKFDHLGCFTYSQEEGTVAGRMNDQIQDDIKKRRQAEIMALQQEISQKRLESYVDKIYDVLVEGPSPDTDLLWQGRLATQAPEVDGVVYINDGDVKAGTIQRVKITDSHDYDLVGEVINLH